MKEKFINFCKGLGTIILYFVLTIVANILFGKYYYSSNLLYATLSQLGTYLLILIVLVIIYHERLLNDFKNFKKSYFKIALKYWLIGLGAMLASNIVIYSLVQRLPVNESANRELLANYPLSMLIATTILGPITEEITFRASLKNAFNNCLTFCLVSALFFGSAHLIVAFTSESFSFLELLFLIPYSLLGFFFAKAFYETDNIYTSTLMHIIHNTIAVILIFIS